MFTTIFYQPIYNLLIFLYNLVPGKDLGVSIILITFIIRLVLYPFSKKAIKSQRELQTIQPEIEKIKEKYKDDKEKMAPELMALYKEKKINPFSSCLPTLIQLPFLIALYRVFLNGITKDNSSANLLYPFIQNPGHLNAIAFGFIDLASKNWIIAILAGLAQFWQSKMLMGSSKQTDMSQMMTNQMIYFMPIFTIIIGGNLPAGLTLYWLFTTIFSIIQQYIVLGFRKKTAQV